MRALRWLPCCPRLPPPGEHALSPLHEGALVTRGVKHVIRTDVLYQAQTTVACTALPLRDSTSHTDLKDVEGVEATSEDANEGAAPAGAA
jgi:hypothetical protein